MSDQTAAPQRPPRLFLRRLAALAVDFLAFALLATIVLGALTTAIPQLRNGLASSFFYTRSCVGADTSLPVFAAIEASAAKAEAGGGATIVQYCTIDSLILPQKHIAAVSRSRAGEDAMTHWVAIQIDAKGEAIFPSPLIERGISTLQLLAFPLALALTTIFLGWTPGKRLLSLTVTGDASVRVPQPLSPGKAVLREYLKFWPLIANNFFQLAIAAQGPHPSSIAEAISLLEIAGKDQRAVVDNLVLNAATLLVLLVWWVWPLLRWRGQTLYDGFVRAYVVLRARSPVNPPGA